jgi:hypothetical protein
MVRADIVPIETLPQEIEKHRILKKKFSCRTVYGIDNTIPLKLNTTVNEVFDCVRDALLKSGNSYAEISLQQIDIFQRNKLRKAQWIVVTPRDADLALAFGLEVSASTSTMQFTGYAVFAPDLIQTLEKGSVSDYNKLIAEAWDRLQESSPQANQWLKLTSDYAFIAIRKLTSARQERRSAF